MSHPPPDVHGTHTSDVTVIDKDSDESGYVPPGSAGFDMHPSNLRPGVTNRASVPSLGYQPVGTTSPMSSPAHNTQFAAYPPDEKARPWNGVQPPPLGPNAHLDRRAWTPMPLKTWFWILYTLVLVGGAITLEVLLNYSNTHQGWKIAISDISAEYGLMHFVYTAPPVAFAMVLVAAWAWTDFEIKKMQPYVDLVHGDSPPERSVLLDYTRSNNFLVWSIAASNKHYVVALASLLTLLALVFSPLAGALLTVRDTWIAAPDMVVNNLAAISLNQADQFWDLTFFLTAAGYASASVLYNLPDPEFIHQGYTVGHFQMPQLQGVNGTVWANTSAILSTPNCQAATSVNMTKTGSGGWLNSATFPGCDYSWTVANVSENLFGVDLCSNSASASGTVPPYFSPVVFWFFTYTPTAAASVTYCAPTISLWDVEVEVDIVTGNLTSVTTLDQFNSQTSNFSSLSGNVTGAPMYGQAYNGIKFNLSDVDPFVLARENATQLTLPAAVFQAAINSPQGITAAFSDGSFVNLVSSVYRKYLALVARTVYFLDYPEPMNMKMKTDQKRLWLSAVAVHLLSVALLLLAFFGVIVQILHRHERQYLRLAHEPGTIASAVVIGAETNMGSLLSGRQDTEAIIQALRDKRFRIDPNTMKIVMEGEAGYESAQSPDPRRSMFGLNQRRASRLSQSFTQPLETA
ncbi:hypothetical protein JAAARDRAFT_32601 [Jaapia argillacea MUCL 33604]|uniref:Uncharacterized protein n=1 Tax=Jaapia argillacea MUCL 33604 TaxID=933084 RepID=A0A067PZI2_9AGAM|nr:hypothetical protein JAAARDRAFT_32601 [Jaapia argillacea MUCL 33604]